jgi:hypothetical protein
VYRPLLSSSQGRKQLLTLDAVVELRESLKGDRSLTFTEIAKLVGEHWQNLSLPEREVYEGQARQSKERYYREMAVYKETSEYRKYMKYLDEFNDKQSKPSQRVYNIIGSAFLPFRIGADLYSFRQRRRKTSKVGAA